MGNEPSPSTVLFFENSFNIILNVRGLDTGFSFFYSTTESASVRVLDRVDATGNLLGALDLAAIGFGSDCGDPGGFLRIWTRVDVSFSGTAKSIAIDGRLEACSWTTSPSAPTRRWSRFSSRRPTP